MEFDLFDADDLPEEARSFEGLKQFKLPVLDDGEVMLVDTMGDDAAIVQAARVSYGAGTTTLSKDRGLIRYLMMHRHTTPFEMCEIKFRVRSPMDCWRQWIRHRTASVNEYSTRYSIAIDAAQKTEQDHWRKQSTKNKQGSGELYDWEMGTRFSDAEAELQEHARKVYLDRLTEFGKYEPDDNESGVAREQARKDLPLSTYTEAYWKIDLHNLFHFLSLRLEAHAQIEIRAFAQAIAYIVQRWVPYAWEAFEDFRLDAMYLSGPEVLAFQEWTRRTARVDTPSVRSLSGGKREKGAFATKMTRLFPEEVTEAE